MSCSSADRPASPTCRTGCRASPSTCSPSACATCRSTPWWRHVAAPPPATRRGAYQLTERGRDLEGVVRELLRWGAPTVPDAPKDAAFQMHWLSMPVRYLLRDNSPDEVPTTLRFGDLRDGFDLTASAGTISVDPCRPDVIAAVTLDGPGPALVRFVQGLLPLDEAAQAGITINGDTSALRRVLPTQQRPAAPAQVMLPDARS